MLLLRRFALRTAGFGGAAALSTASCARSESAAPQLFRLDGRVALVTGSSRGIGYAIAVGLAEQGAHVVMSGTNKERVESARLALLSDTGVNPDKISCVAFNVTDEQGCIDAVQAVARQTGRTPDILVNNAGLNHRTALDDFTTERFEHVLRANLVGPFILARECAPGMRERGWGRIVNVGSIMGHVGRAGMHAYCSSKHGIAGLTKTLAAELGEFGICVNCVEPGYIRTDLTKGLQAVEAFEAEVTNRTPVGRWGVPREMAGPAVFLCTDAAGYVNGAQLVADGGMIETFHGGPMVAKIK